MVTVTEGSPQTQAPPNGGSGAVVSIAPEVHSACTNISAIDGADRFRVMADCAPVMLWMSGPDSRCIFFNQPWLDFTGRTMSEELGFGWSEGVHPEDFQHCVDTFMIAFKARQEFSMEYRLRRNDGEFRWLLDTGRPYRSGDGSFAGFIGSCIDITTLKEARNTEVERARLEARIAERERAAAVLAATNNELEAFAYTVSHNLRAPLRSIDGFVRLLLDDPTAALTPGSRHQLNMVRHSAQDMDTLIHGLLKFSQSSRQPLRRRELDMMEIASAVREDLRPIWGDRGMDFSIRDLPSCQGDPVLVKQVFVNLLENAVKFTRKRESARIQVGVHEQGGQTVYYVSDNGAGFNMQQSAKLFGVFQRLHNQDDFEGTGAGLAIAQRIILRHGGRIWADGEPERGATFFFTIPE